MNVDTLGAAMKWGVTRERYEQLCPAFNHALIEANCTTVNRVAMFCAQLGEESGGLRWMEELASGAEYEWRSDLGNTQPGDGVRFKGRGPIQITGRSNYARLSQWAFDLGYVPSPSYFVDNPTQLSNDIYGFLGPVWYWTVARNMNGYADAGDIYGATRAVNGGLNGIDDRISRWNNARTLGDALLPEDDMAGITYTNMEGNVVDQATFMFWVDKRVKEILEQLTGYPEFKGWPQLDNKSVVDALALIGAKLGIEGFVAPTDGK